MSDLIVEAQELIVIDPSMTFPMENQEISLVPLEVSDQDSYNEHNDNDVIEVSEPSEIEIMLDELPGAPEGTKDPELFLEVSDKDTDKKEDVSNLEDTKPKKNEKWDWESKGAEGFVAWIKSRVDDVPKHSGYDSAGLERAMAYLDRVDNEISRAMRLDLDGELDANKIEEVRSQIDEGLSRLHDRLDKVRKSTKSRRKKKAEADLEIIKEGQKIMGVQAVFITVPLYLSRIARVCANGMVSGGHDLVDMFKKQAKKHKLTEREQIEVIQLLEDMGYHIREDRGLMPDEEIDFSSSDNFDYAANYQA